MNLFDCPTTPLESPLLTGMNDEQKLAIQQTDGPLLILAGAGSGKTRVVTHRIAYLIDEIGIAPWNILAITFTNKAAREMKERTTDLSPFGSDVWISTFHSMCVSILRRHIDFLGYEKNFAILDDADQISALKKVLKNLNIDPTSHSPKYYLSRITEAKNKMQLPPDIKPDIFIEDKFKQVYENYQQILHTNNRLDFDDLLMLTVHLFEKNPATLEYYQQKFKYIHVDEYQDTNHAQYKIVKLLAGFHRNICVVGDSDQSIYSWRGADITNILTFEKDYEEAIVIKLEQNYRSTGNILDAANDVIKNNPVGYKKHLFSELGIGSKIIAKQVADGNDEVRYVTKEIKNLVNSGINHEEIVILYRKNSLSRLFEQHFIKANIPYRIVGGLSYFKRKEIKDLVAFLRLILDFRDDFSFERIINVPTRGIGAATIAKISTTARDIGCSMLDAIPTLAQSLAGATSKKLLKFYQLITMLQSKLDQMKIPEFIKMVLVETGYLEMLEAEDTIESRSRIENLYEFKNMAITFEKDQLAGIIAQEELEFEIDKMTTGEKLAILLTDIGLQTDVVEDDGETTEKITLMTVHAAKGLEFNTVFLVGFEEGIFPLLSSITAGADEIAEERRLAYVAITRAKRRLFITSARERMHQGKMIHNSVSRFQEEIDTSRLDVQEDDGEFHSFRSFSDDEPLLFNSRTSLPRKPKPMPSTAKMSKPIAKKSANTNSDGMRGFSVGNKITHDTMGDGVVVVNDGQRITIAFSAEHGIKKFKPDHPAIRLR